MPAPLTADQLARRIGVKPATVLRWARDGQIPCHRVAARIWFDLAEVQAATFQPAKAPAVVQRSQPDEAQPAEMARYLEIIGGRKARGDAAQAQKTKKTGRVSGSGRPG